MSAIAFPGGRSSETPAIPDASVTAAKLDSGAATAGQVYKADGSGGGAYGSLDGSDVGLADSPSADGVYNLTRAGGVNSWTSASGGGGSPGMYVLPSENWWLSAPSGSEVQGECVFVSHAGTGDFAGKNNQLAIKGASSWSFIDPATATQPIVVRVTGSNHCELRLDVVGNKWVFSAGGFQSAQDATLFNWTGGTTFPGAIYYVAGSGLNQWSGADKQFIVAHVSSPASSADWTKFDTDYGLLINDFWAGQVKAKISAGASLVTLG